MTRTEKLQAIGSKIGKMKLEMEIARRSGDYETLRLKKNAIHIANQEFRRISRQTI